MFRRFFALFGLLLFVSGSLFALPAGAAPGDFISDSNVLMEPEIPRLTDREVVSPDKNVWVRPTEAGGLLILTAPLFEPIVVNPPAGATMELPRFTPDSQNIVVLLTNADASTEYAVVPSTGGAVTPLGGPGLSLPSFSADSKYLVSPRGIGFPSIVIEIATGTSATLDSSDFRVELAGDTMIVSGTNGVDAIPFPNGTRLRLSEPDQRVFQLETPRNGNVVYSAQTVADATPYRYSVPVVGGTVTQLGPELTVFGLTFDPRTVPEVTAVLNGAGGLDKYDFATNTATAMSGPTGLSNSFTYSGFSDNGRYFAKYSDLGLVVGDLDNNTYVVVDPLTGSDTSTSLVIVPAVSNTGAVAYMALLPDETNRYDYRIAQAGQVGFRTLTQGGGVRSLITADGTTAVFDNNNGNAVVVDLATDQSVVKTGITHLVGDDGYLVSRVAHFAQISVLRDTDSPTVASTSDITVPATSASGAPVDFDVPTAVDARDPFVTVSCDRASGSNFPVGTTTVTCTATDSTGNPGIGTFDVTVTDTTPPVVGTVASFSVPTTSQNGAVVTYTPPSATDNVDGNLAVTCSPDSGTQFALGTTTVTCSATDAAGNSDSSTFTVFVFIDLNLFDCVATIEGATVKAVVTPAFAFEEPFMELASGGDRLFVDLDSITDVDGTTVAIAPTDQTTQGVSYFVGLWGTGDDSPIECGTVTIPDTTPPVVGAVGDIIAPSTSQDGVAVNFATPTASDNIDGTVPVTCDPTSGTVFGTGQHTVTCSAIDAAGNVGETQFTITVFIDLDAFTCTATFLEGGQIEVVVTPGIELVEPVVWLDGVQSVNVVSVSDVDGSTIAVTAAGTYPAETTYSVGLAGVSSEALLECGTAATPSDEVTIDTLLEDLRDARDNTNNNAATDLNKAIKDVIKAQEELDKGHTDHAIAKLRSAENDIAKAVQDGFPAAEADAIIADIVTLAKTLAQGEIDAAIARNGLQDRIDVAQAEFALALAELDNGAVGDALNRFSMAAAAALTA